MARSVCVRACVLLLITRACTYLLAQELIRLEDLRKDGQLERREGGLLERGRKVGEQDAPAVELRLRAS